MERCDVCGFGWDETTAAELPARITAAGPRFRALLLPPDRPAGWSGLVSTRPDADTWSPLEYACHVRDVLLVQRDRLYVALVEDTPTFTPMYRDERVDLGSYSEEDAGEVATQIEVASRLLARSFAVLDAALLGRTCVYAYPTIADRSLVWLGAQSIHEVEHHAADAAAGLPR